MIKYTDLMKLEARLVVARANAMPAGEMPGTKNPPHPDKSFESVSFMAGARSTCTCAGGLFAPHETQLQPIRLQNRRPREPRELDQIQVPFIFSFSRRTFLIAEGEEEKTSTVFREFCHSCHATVLV